MKITLVHKVTILEATITTNHDDPDEVVTVIFGGAHFEQLLHELSKSYGHYGHLIDTESTTNLDLQSAAHKLPSFELKSIEPEIKPRPLPEGAIS